jgi:hypothetical protein
MCESLGVSKSGWYAARRRAPSRRAVENARLVTRMQSLQRRHRGRYGRRRMHRVLRDEAGRINEKRVGRLMRQHGLQSRLRRRFRVVTTDSRHAYPVAPNVLARDFEASAPDRKWLVDLTYVATDEGWLYLALVLDLFSRKFVGWAMSERIDEDLALQALVMALEWRRPTGELMHHSDRGSHGGFNRSLQHLLTEVSHGTTTGLGFGTDGKTNNAIAWQARCQSARDKAGVLELYRAGHGDRGCRTGMWRVTTFGTKMVS